MYTVFVFFGFLVSSFCILMDGQLIGESRRRKETGEINVLISSDRNCSGSKWYYKQRNRKGEEKLELVG